MPEKKVGVFGAGPAGIAAVRRLAEKGHEVTWYYPEVNFVRPRSVYTTRTESPDLNEHMLEHHVLPLTYIRLMNSSGADVRRPLPHTSYIVVDNVKFVLHSMEAIKKEFPKANEQPLPDGLLRTVKVAESPESVEVAIDGKNVNIFDAVVDATGIGAVISQQTERRPSTNFLTEYVYGAQFPGFLDLNELILIRGVLGGTCWVCPSVNNKNGVDVVFSGWGSSKDFTEIFLRDANRRLELLYNFVNTNVNGVTFRGRNILEHYSGLIRSERTSIPTSSRVFTVGEASGVARSTTGQSFDRSYRSGLLSADAINSGWTPQKFYKCWNKIWKDSLFLAGTVAALPYQRRSELGGTYLLEKQKL